VIDELAKPAKIGTVTDVGSEDKRTARDLWRMWDTAKFAGVPREAVLAVLLSIDAPPVMKNCALITTLWQEHSRIVVDLIYTRIYARLSPSAGLPLSSAAVVGALSDPANDVLRQLAAALLNRPTRAKRATASCLQWLLGAMQPLSAISWVTASLATVGLRCQAVIQGPY